LKIYLIRELYLADVAASGFMRLRLADHLCQNRYRFSLIYK
jgi:hypothetical protein